MKLKRNPWRSINWGGRSLCLLLVLAVLSPILAVAPSHGAEALARVQPVLLQVAASDKGVEDLMARLGGTVTKDLSIINAFVAELPAKSLPEANTGLPISPFLAAGGTSPTPNANWGS